MDEHAEEEHEQHAAVLPGHRGDEGEVPVSADALHHALGGEPGLLVRQGRVQVGAAPEEQAGEGDEDEGLEYGPGVREPGDGFRFLRSARNDSAFVILNPGGMKESVSQPDEGTDGQDQRPDEEEVPDGGRGEDRKGVAHGAEGADDDALDRTGPARPELVDDLAEAVQAAPDHEVPAGAVPEAAEEHRVHGIDLRPEELAPVGPEPAVNEQSHRQRSDGYRYPPRTGQEGADDRDGDDDDVGAPGRVPVAAQRDVQVIPEPAGKGHVPATPELLGVLRLVGGIEVLREVEAHQEGDACRDVRVAGEVGIDLEGVAEQGGEVLETGVQERIPEHPVTEVHGEVIGQDELLHQAVHDPEHGDTEPPAAQVVGLVQLREELRGPDDRAGHKLREEGQEEAEIQEIMDGFHLLPLHVHHVADGLEGEEGDAHGKDDGIDPEELRSCDQVPQFPEDVPHLDGDSEEVADEVRQEIRVLEIRQDAQVHHHGKHHPEGLPARPRPVQPPGCEKVVGDDE